MARILVTGAAGVIGFELARELVARGESVEAVDSGRKGGLDDLRALAERHPGSLSVSCCDLARDRSALKGRYDAIAHLAAIVGVRYVCDHPYETLDVNLRSTLNVLDHAVEHGCGAFVFASSSENYASGADAGQIPIPTPESVPLSISDIRLPRFSYAASKIAGESALFAAAGGFTPVVVRFHNVYGPRMGPTHVIPEFLERVRLRTDPFPVYGPEQTRSFLYAEDAGRALVRVLDAARGGQGGIYNLGSSEETEIGALARMVFDVTSFHPRLAEHPAPPGSVRRRVPDVRRLAALGFEPTVSLREGVRRCWETVRARRASG